MAFIKDFNELGKGDAARAGGKGASLGEMTQAGIPVPPGFVLLASGFEHFLEETNLSAEIDALLHSVNKEEMRSVEHASERIQKMILEAKMPDDIAREIEKNFKKLDVEFVAVRSSATAEDSASAAWAGQLDSYLNTTSDSVLKNVQRCWASLFTPRAIFYRFEKDLHRTKISVAVVVQKMVESEFSGIAFSVHPVTEDRNQLIIEAGFGLGEAIVSGQITPDSYVVEKVPQRIIDKNISTQTRGLYRAPGGGNEWISIAEPRASSQVLTDTQIRELSELILKIENHYGFPCDIEWAYEEGRFFIVQSRPITTLAQNRSITSQNKKVWAKNFSGVQIGLQIMAMLDRGIKNGEDTLFGKNRPSLITEFFWRMDGVDLEGAYFLKNEIHAFAKTICEAIYADPEKIERIHREAYMLSDKYFAYTKKHLGDDLHKLSNTELGKIYATLTDLQVRAHEHAVTTTWFVDSTQQVFSQRLIADTRNIVEKSGLDKNPLDVFTVLTTSSRETFALQEELEFLEILKLIQADAQSEKTFSLLSDYLVMPQGIATVVAEALQRHCVKWEWTPFGYMGPAYGLDHYLFDMATLVRLGTDAKKEIIEKKNRRKIIEKEREALFRELHIDAQMKKIYDIAADITFLKTYRKDCLYYGMYFLEKLFREMKSRLDIGLMDMHYLYFTEIKGIFIDGKAVDIQEIARRKKSAIFHQKDNGRTEILTGEKAEDFLQNASIEEEKSGDQEGLLQGTCACSGFAQGKVKIINRPEEMGKMEQGDIMVSHTTFPSLVSAMKKAAAIVTEDGGITCHAAIVARELKTPCVTGIKIAMQVLKDGDLVEVDADNGVVRIVEKAGISDLSVPDISHFECTFESQGTSFIIESVINEYYNPSGTVSIARNNAKMVFVSRKTLQRMNSEGEALSPEELFSIADSLEHSAAQAKEETGKFAAKKKFSREDAEHMIELLGKISKEYFFFDMNMWDSTFKISKKNAEALKKVKIVESFKNKIRAEADPVFFDKQGYLFTLLSKMSEYSGVPKEKLQYYRYQEILRLFDGEEISDDEMKNRQRGYAYFKDGANGNIFYSGQEAFDFADRFLGKSEENSPHAESRIVGQVANGSGKKVTGVVRVIARDYNDPEATRKSMSVMNKGDILVSPTTDPEMMDAIRKAAAIVTDIGGLLSHSAIVARELDIPCIIGTRNASKVLHTGDVVEVDACPSSGMADNGMIRIIEHGKIR